MSGELTSKKENAKAINGIRRHNVNGKGRIIAALIATNEGIAATNEDSLPNEGDRKDIRAILWRDIASQVGKGNGLLVGNSADKGRDREILADGKKPRVPFQDYSVVFIMYVDSNARGIATTINQIDVGT